MDNLVVIAAFATGVLIILGGYFVIVDTQSRRRKTSADSAELAASVGGLSEQDFADSQLQGSGTSQPAWPTRLQIWIDQSGLRLSTWALIAMSITLSVLPTLTVYFVTSSPFLAVPLLLLGGVPVGIVSYSRSKRANKLRDQLPDALELMSRMLRAGQTIPQSIRGIADEFSQPISDEFGYCYEQQNLGMPTDAAMQELARRTGLLELRILVVALTVHRQAGGNLSELLDKLAAVIRDRHRIQGQIRALTADGRMQAAILLGLPPFLMVVLSIVNRDYITILFQFPWLLTGMFAFEVLGALWLRQIVNFDF